ncbi:hypothetical protein [Saccharopolyspora shandongensis]|uniref:hypothetical protein n=1 Tax=Saccharopolyspora shandongensis TaxID=418495 RepID=UPI0033D427B9
MGENGPWHRLSGRVHEEAGGVLCLVRWFGGAGDRGRGDRSFGEQRELVRQFGRPARCRHQLCQIFVEGFLVVPGLLGDLG